MLRVLLDDRRQAQHFVRGVPPSGRIPEGRTSVTDGLPLVRVPVLSKTMTWSLLAASMASAPLKRMPFWAPIPEPAIMAAGVARPTAQGQEIMRTVTDRSRANPKTPISVSS
jgi:hypothetical protein